MVERGRLKRNDTAQQGCRLYLTKPIGIGVLTTAEKQGKLRDEHRQLATDWMCRLNRPGSRFGRLPAVRAMTDVTGFGLLGHLVEMADGSGLTARVRRDAVPLLPGVRDYIGLGCVPGGTQRNFDSYGHRIAGGETGLDATDRAILCDPQTSGGLLVAVSPGGESDFLAAAAEFDLKLDCIGEMIARGSHAVEVR
ncbi:selenophosphate synthase [Cupriavidus gilardii J11]|uniref:Selenophosphate synthase n=1 Tax=Cupriavidus gilardii J11 TaxID=936133 RepID=A0A562BF47_9BURK|nr:selenophosphate synthase [Cupriavidus gilardii J11]